MSKVKIKGNASGTGVLTIEAPNTDTDRTITLPDGTGELIQADASGNVGIGTTTPSDLLDIVAPVPTIRLTDTDGGCYHLIKAPGNGDLRFEADAGNTASGSNIQFNVDGTEYFTIESDGRGLSQFTAKAWVNFDGRGTVAISDSHNISSVTDSGTGYYTVNFDNAMSNANYAATATGSVTSGASQNYSTGVQNDSHTTTGYSVQRESSMGVASDTEVSSIVFGD